MGELIRQSQHLKGPISEFFILEGVLAQTATADLYKAVDKTRDEAVFLWVTKQSLPLHSEEVDKFLARLKALQEIPSVANVLTSFGIDSTGIGYAVLPPLDGKSLESKAGMSHANAAQARTAIAEAERRFGSCVKTIESIHGAELVCGDISHNSFWVDRDGNVLFIGVIGATHSNFNASNSNAAAVPSEVSAYIDSTATTITTAQDVYSLGMLGYFLMSNRAPDHVQGVSTPLSELIPNAPLWADEVLLRCLNSDPAARYANATELLSGIAEARRKSFEQAELPTKNKTEVAKKSSSVLKQPGFEATARPGFGSSGSHQLGSAVGPNSGGSAGDDDSDEEVSKGPSPLIQMLSRMRLLIAAVVVFVVSLVLASRFASKTIPKPENPTDSEVQRVASVENPNIQKAVDATKVTQNEVAEAQARFEQLVASDDPLHHVLLVKSALEAKSPEIKSLAERSIVERVRRVGMLRSAEQLRQWLRTVPSGTPPPSYEPLLKSLNANLPAEARLIELRKAYASDPRNTLKLAAALTLDSANSEDYQPLLSQLIGDALSMDNAQTHSALGLILAHRDLALIYGDDVVQRRSEIPDSDVVWLLNLLGERNDFQVRAFATLAVDRGLLPPLRRYYLTVIKEQGDKVPPEVVNALIRASAGAVLIDQSINDISAIGLWFDSETERILLVLCADLTDKKLLTEAFDTLAGKSLVIQPSAELVDWVRRYHWDKRADFIKAIGIFGNLSIATPEEVKTAFAAFEPYLTDNRLLNLFLNTKNAAIARLVLDNHAGSMPLSVLLNLLDNDDPQVRIASVLALQRYNDVGVLKMILEHYEREQDSEVKKVYRDSYEMIREREQ